MTTLAGGFLELGDCGGCTGQLQTVKTKQRAAGTRRHNTHQLTHKNKDKLPKPPRGQAEEMYLFGIHAAAISPGDPSQGHICLVCLSAHQIFLQTLSHSLHAQ